MDKSMNPVVLSTSNRKAKSLGSLRHFQPLLLSIPHLIKAGEYFGLIMMEVELDTKGAPNVTLLECCYSFRRTSCTNGSKPTDRG